MLIEKDKMFPDDSDRIVRPFSSLLNFYKIFTITNTETNQLGYDYQRLKMKPCLQCDKKNIEYEQYEIGLSEAKSLNEVIEQSKVTALDDALQSNIENTIQNLNNNQKLEFTAHRISVLDSPESQLFCSELLKQNIQAFTEKFKFRKWKSTVDQCEMTPQLEEGIQYGIRSLYHQFTAQEKRDWLLINFVLSSGDQTIKQFKDYCLSNNESYENYLKSD